MICNYLQRIHEIVIGTWRCPAQKYHVTRHKVAKYLRLLKTLYPFIFQFIDE